MKSRLAWFCFALCLCGIALPAIPQSNPPLRKVYFAAGQPTAPVRIEVFSDYQCFACRTFYTATLSRLLNDAETENRVSVVYHDFPLQMHPYAREASRYALAARRLGKKQWAALTEAFYSRQDQWSADGKVGRIAEEVLSPQDYARVKDLAQDPSIEQEIKEGLELGHRLQVNATPTFFIVSNGRAQRVVGGVPYQVLDSYIQNMSKQQSR